MGLISLVMMGISGITHAVRAANPDGAQKQDDSTANTAATARTQTAQEKQRLAALASQDAAGAQSFAQHFQAQIAKAADTNGDGVISLDELAQKVKAGGGTLEQAGKLYKSLDKNGDGKVSIDEFKDGMPVPKSALAQHVLKMLQASHDAQAATAGAADAAQAATARIPLQLAAQAQQI